MADCNHIFIAARRNILRSFPALLSNLKHRVPRSQIFHLLSHGSWTRTMSAPPERDVDLFVETEAPSNPGFHLQTIYMTSYVGYFLHVRVYRVQSATWY